MTSEVWREFTFEAAHRLTRVPSEHKCARVHGHSYRATLYVRGAVGRDSGMIVDFAQIDAAWAPLHARLDHQLLNEVVGLGEPTAERLAEWIFWELSDRGLAGLWRVEVRETARGGAAYSRQE